MSTYAKLTGALVVMASLCIGQPWAFAQGEVAVHWASEDPVFLSQGAAYWTPERIREAKPMPWYDAEADKEARPFVAGPEGPPGSVPSVLLSPTPRQHGALEPQEAFPAESEAEDNADFDADYGTQDVYDNNYINQNTTLWKQWPWRAVGKLMITFASGGSGWCTASVISPNNIIVTAGHCCYDRSAKAYNKSFTFVPAMRENTQPYGSFPFTKLTVLQAWIDQGDRPNDVCVLNLGKNASGQTVVSAIGGSLGISYDFPIIQHHRAFGYPSNISSGLYKYECAAESYANCGDGNVYAMGCNMTNGSSGGPWILLFKMFTGGSVNFVNSVVSGADTCTGTSSQSFNGARFTSNNIVPLCKAAGC